MSNPLRPCKLRPLNMQSPLKRAVIVGYETQVTPNGEQTAHVCPKCRQASVFSSTSTKEIIVLFVPVSSNAEALWVCTTENCGWKTPLEKDPASWEPTPDPPKYDEI
ncbi:hypothetical protein C8R43DRAFT_983397 [Mycena crocata]|nr:hypothetical protein C8R43DRAFT_983397 [Mycena crocata]